MDRPPLGLKPKTIVTQTRLREIRSAIYRYIDAGKMIPQSWITEYFILLKGYKRDLEEFKEDAYENTETKENK